MFAKKLKTKAVVLEMMFATNLSIPNIVSRMRIPKSSAVLRTPTTRKRPSVCLAFMMRLVKLVDEIEWAAFCLIEYAANVFTDDTEAE